MSATRKLARINARLARRIGWRSSEVHVVDATDKAASFYAEVGGRKFDVFTDAKLAERLAETFGVNFKFVAGKFHACLRAGYESSGFDTPNEALVAAILAQKRKELRNLRVSH